ncbi:hypothetical protein [Dyella sp. 2RAB6]|uniref:hypothetical protein n=1 Tax=Dyella sp. 2RAB6 TaxID=3232992 RepID=UPI003F914E2E
MFVLSVIVMAVLALWLAGALIGVVFKFTFAIVGGVFSVLGTLLGLLIAGVVLVAMAPIVLLAMLPALLPVLLIAGLVWLVVRAARPAPSSTPSIAKPVQP